MELPSNFFNRSPSSQNDPFSIPDFFASTDTDTDDTGFGLGTDPFSSIFSKFQFQLDQSMNFSSQTVPSSLEINELTPKEVTETLTQLFELAEQLIEQLKSYAHNPSKIQEHVTALMEFRKITNGIFDIGSQRKNLLAISKLSTLYQDAPQRSDQIISQFFFQYTEVRSFTHSDQPLQKQEQTQERIKIAHFQFQMILILEEKGKTSPKTKELMAQLKNTLPIKDSLALVNNESEEVVDRLTEEVADILDETVSTPISSL
jgi:hypothetical protein